MEPKENALRMKKKVKRRLDRISDVRHSEKVERRRRGIPGVRHPGEWRRRRIPGVRHLDGMAAKKDSECETSGWNGGAEGFRE